MEQNKNNTMEKSKLLGFMRSFSKSEMKEFGKFLESASFRKTSKVFKLYIYLNKLHPEFPNKKIEKEYVAKKVLQETGNISKKMADTMTQLFGVIEDFIIKKELEENKIERDFLLLEAMKKRKLDKFFFQKIEQVEKDWQKSPPPGIKQLYNEYKLADFRVTHPNYDNFLNDRINSEDLIEKIDSYYLTVKLFLTLNVVSIGTDFVNKSNKIQNDPKYFTKQIIKLSIMDHFQKQPRIKLVSDLLTCIINKSHEQYFSIKDYFINNLSLFDENEKRDLFSLVYDYCFKIYQNGKSDFLKELFELNKLFIKHELIFNNGYVANIDFLNIINIACAIHEANWANNFIESYGSYLKDDDRKDIIDLCQIRVFMLKKQYFEALSNLTSINFLNSYYTIQAKAIQLQCYYELGEDYLDLFLNHSNAFYIYLIRNKEIAENLKLAFKNFIAIVKKLQKATNSPTEKKIVEIENIFRQSTPIINKNWLQTKIEEIKKA